MNKLTALVEAAKAATPGSWMWPNVGSSDFVISGPDRLAIGHLDSPRTAEFVALANPATILELCALLEQAEKALNQSVIVRERLMRWRRNAWPSTDQETIVSGEYPLMDKALAAIKQWKEKT